MFQAISESQLTFSLCTFFPTTDKVVLELGHSQRPFWITAKHLFGSWRRTWCLASIHEALTVEKLLLYGARTNRYDQVAILWIFRPEPKVIKLSVPETKSGSIIGSLIVSFECCDSLRSKSQTHRFFTLLIYNSAEMCALGSLNSECMTCTCT